MKKSRFRPQKFLFAILFASAAGTLAAVNEEGSGELHPIFSESYMKSRAPASAWPEEFVQSFAVTAPDGREPASLSARSKKKSALRVEKGDADRRSRLPSSVSDGFEIRTKQKDLVTTFWVVKRAGHYDLLYANSADSKASVSLSVESFNRLQESAARIPASDGDIKGCVDNSMQLHVVAPGRKERTSTFCLNSKTKAADQLRALGNSLVVWVR